ncbi:hypothetical protein [Comamonas sp. B21-038]|uniref:hypothetical protein n=1 Tax=Comamonas sp. B21-038 TaxID=2918299 RepID=UPI001EFB0D69|nr:hypothetical protein [Comamonas sp. B21-038]ULR87208.1 hypothetical protein MJ205_12025 [Comamonas sp. B21-038]
MKALEITGEETAADLVKQLVALRMLARQNVRTRRQSGELLAGYRAKLALTAVGSDDWTLTNHLIAAIEENRLACEFHEIEIGKYLMFLCHEMDQKVPRALIFDAINTSHADRDTEDVRKYGDKSHHLICILDLENSATQDDDIEIRPLKWCHTMAFMNAMQTNGKLSKAVHDIANETFGGAFGEFRETPLMDRLAGTSVQ